MQPNVIALCCLFTKLSAILAKEEPTQITEFVFCEKYDMSQCVIYYTV